MDAVGDTIGDAQIGGSASCTGRRANVTLMTISAAKTTTKMMLVNARKSLMESSISTAPITRHVVPSASNLTQPSLVCSMARVTVLKQIMIMMNLSNHAATLME